MNNTEKQIYNKLQLFPIFKCKTDKKPMVGHWKEEKDQLLNTESMGKHKTFGLVCGPGSNIMVLDIDCKDKTALEVLEGLVLAAQLSPEDKKTLSETFKVETPNKGLHYFFQYREGLTNTTSEILKNVDFKTTDGYTISPYSQAHDRNGILQTYLPVDIEAKILEMPERLYQFAKKSKGKKQFRATECDLAYPFIQLRGMPAESGRNTALNNTLFTYCKDNRIIAREDIFALAENINNNFADPLPNTELQATANSIYQGVNRELQEEPWEQPLAFDSYINPPFPTICLPSWVRACVEAVAETTQTAPDMAAVVALAVMAIPCAKIFKVEGKPGWLEPLNLFTTFIANPGERKSAVMQYMTKPIHDFEAFENEILRADIARNQAARKVLEGEVNRLQGIVVKNNNLETGADHMSKVDELANFKDIQGLRFTCDDCTPEKLVDLLSDHKERMALVSAEGGLFDMIAGRYSKSVNLDIYLKGHSGDYVKVDRIGRESEHLKEPSLTTILAVQPAVIRGIIENGTFRGRGLLARFLYSYPDSNLGNRNISSEQIPNAIEELYSQNIQLMLKTELPENPRVLHLGEDAKNISMEFAQELEPRLIEDLENIADWASKLHGAILRIAGILHVATYFDFEPDDTPISEDTMQSAIDIGRYFMAHAVAVFGIMGADRNLEKAKRVVQWLKTQGKTELKKTDIMEGNRSFKRIDELSPVLDILCEFRYLREQPTEWKQGGRRADRVYIVNPLLYP